MVGDGDSNDRMWEARLAHACVGAWVRAYVRVRACVVSACVSYLYLPLSIVYVYRKLGSVVFPTLATG